MPLLWARQNPVSINNCHWINKLAEARTARKDSNLPFCEKLKPIKGARKLLVLKNLHSIRMLIKAALSSIHRSLKMLTTWAPSCHRVERKTSNYGCFSVKPSFAHGTFKASQQSLTVSSKFGHLLCLKNLLIIYHYIFFCEACLLRP